VQTYLMVIPQQDQRHGTNCVSNNQSLEGEGKLLYFTVLSLCLTCLSSSKLELALAKLALEDSETVSISKQCKHRRSRFMFGVFSSAQLYSSPEDSTPISSSNWHS